VLKLTLTDANDAQFDPNVMVDFCALGNWSTGEGEAFHGKCPGKYWAGNVRGMPGYHIRQGQLRKRSSTILFYPLRMSNWACTKSDWENNAASHSSIKGKQPMLSVIYWYQCLL